MENFDEISAVTSPDYFLSEDGNQNAQLELIATIKSFFDQWSDEPNKHSLCRFPARYYWLSKYIEFPNRESLMEEKCSHLNIWGTHKTTDSISLVLVGGYLGNPASSFGHALLKINSSKAGHSHNLFSKTVNFGADVPVNEPILKYILYGIFGGYKAAFSNQYFATQDYVYSRTEHRDMWEYKLKLNDAQMKLLLLHIWEIAGKEFNYYFFDDNCAYRIAQLAELLINQPLSVTDKPWYLPEVLFSNLQNAYDANNKSVIEDIKFIPSSKRLLFRKMDLLSEEELSIVQQIIEDENHNSDAWNRLSQLEITQQIFILDTLLAYHQYLLISQANNSSPYITKLKKEILLARLKLPAKAITSPPKTTLESPTLGNREAVISTYALLSEDMNDGFGLGFAAYKRDHMSRGSLDSNELILFDFNTELISGDLKFDSAHLLKVSNLKPESYTIGSDKSWAWQFDLGARRDHQRDLTEYYFEGGIGESFTVLDDITFFTLLNSYIYSTDNHGSLGAKIGFTYFSKNLNLSASTETAWDREGERRNRSVFQFSTEISNSISIVFEASDRSTWEVKGGLRYYF